MKKDPSHLVRRLYPEFWNYFCKYLHQNNPSGIPKSPPKQHYISFGIGRRTKRCGLLRSSDNRIGVRFQAEGKNKGVFYDQLWRQKEEIEAELGFGLDWQRKDGRKYAQASYFREADLKDRSRWEDYCKWMKTNLDKLEEVFRPRVKDLNTED